MPGVCRGASTKGTFSKVSYRSRSGDVRSHKFDKSRALNKAGAAYWS